MKISKEQILKNIETITNHISTKLSEPNKTTLLKVMDGEVGEMFFTAPASSKEKYHLAVPGGLAQHVLNVYDAFRKLNETFQCSFSDEEMFLCALLHDFGKICTPDLKSPHYKASKEKWKLDRGEFYDNDYSNGFMTNRDRTSFMLQALGVKVTGDQFQALLISDGWFTEQNRGYNDGICKLAYFLHFADFIATRLEKD